MLCTETYVLADFFSFTSSCGQSDVDTVLSCSCFLLVLFQAQRAPAGSHKTGTGSTAANRDKRAKGQQLSTNAKATAQAGTSEHQRSPDRQAPDGHRINGGQPQQSGTRAAVGKSKGKDTVTIVGHLRDLSRYRDGWLNSIVIFACA